MTIPDRDLYAAAAMLIREHGEEAHSIATNRADELKTAGDEAGYAAFTRIAAAVREIGQLKPAAGDSSVNVKVNQRNASAKIGLIWGISNYFIVEPISKMLKILKSEFDENGRPLPNLPDKIELTDTFYPKKI